MGDWFVANKEELSKIKVTRLRKLLKIGCSIDQPLKNKALVSAHKLSEDNIYVLSLNFFNPFSGPDTPPETFEFNDQTKISVVDWNKIFRHVVAYEVWLQVQKQNRDILKIVKNFETAAKKVGSLVEADDNAEKSLEIARKNLLKYFDIE